MSLVTVIVGAQWGDEGKGKWVDILAQSKHAIARYQGGNNAGHTLYIDGKKIVLHQIPSGIFHAEQICALLAGVVVNPAELVLEIEKIKTFGAHVNPSRLWLSARAHVITPWHIELDRRREQDSKNPIGTTKRGIGPTYSAKAARTGIRIGEYVDKDRRKHWISEMAAHDHAFASHFAEHRETWERFESAATELAPFVCDAEHQIRQMLKEGRKVLLEGAQGALLDIDHGTYPYVTSSNTAAGGAVASLGFNPHLVDQIIGVAKAYATRVGEGPFPTELHDEVGQHIAHVGKEFGATTGRARRCGWLDIVALRYAVEASGCHALILNKMDILNDLDTIKYCVAYQHPKLGKLTTFPWDAKILADCTPVYESVPGWKSELPDHDAAHALPQAAKAYIKRVEELVGVPVSMVGTGVARQHAIFIK